MAPKAVLFRITGVPREAAVEDLVAALRTLLKDNEKETEIKVDITPHCDIREQKLFSIGLVSFRPETPTFVKPLFEGRDAVQVETHLGDLNIEKNFYGLTQLYNTPLGEDIKADIIAVTGLDGHAIGSWRGRGDLGRIWLKDFLSRDFPNCRTMAWGYNSKLQSSGIHRITDYNTILLEDIRRSRSDKDRPIVFIGHSFGGIIIAQSLVTAKEAIDLGDSGPYPIYHATRAIFFFGTPHRGLLIENIQTMVDENSGRRDLLDSIRLKSEQLYTELSRFINFASRYKIYSFYETAKSKGLRKNEEGRWERSGEEYVPVERESAVLNLPTTVETRIPVDMDHSNIVKWDHRGDPTYQHVVSNLQSLLDQWGQGEWDLQRPIIPSISPESRTWSASSLTSLPYRPSPGPSSIYSAPSIAPTDTFIANTINPSELNVAPLKAESRVSSLPIQLTPTASPTYKVPVRTPTDAFASKANKSSDPALHHSLYAATKARDINLVRNLLNQGADPMFPAREAKCAMCVAVQQGFVAAVGAFLEAGADPDWVYIPASGEKPLLVMATDEQHEEVVRLLLQYRADPNRRRGNGETALTEAVYHNNVDIIEELLRYGADPNIHVLGSAALHRAAEGGKSGAVSLLLDHGADPNIRITEGSDTEISANKDGGFLRKAFGFTKVSLQKFVTSLNKGDTPLHLAAEYKKIRVAEILIQRGADINALDSEQQTALHRAMEWGSEKIVSLLIDSGANTSILVDDKTLYQCASGSMKEYLRKNHGITQ